MRGRLRQLEDLPAVQGQRVLVRADYNVPLAGEGVGRTVADDSRIRGSLPTLSWLLERGARVIVCSHLGRPKGAPDPELTLAPVADRLGELLAAAGVEATVRACPTTVGADAKSLVAELAAGDVLVLENLRFHAGETKGDRAFAGELAELADAYVGDAFGAAHRAHASVSVVPELLPSAAGRLLAREVDVLGGILESPGKPFAALLGGAKVSDKIGVVESLVERCDAILVGGGMAYTFLAARGQPVGGSKVEDADGVEAAARLLALADERGVRLELPVDHVTADRFAEDATPLVETQVSDGRLGLDIGPRTLEAYERLLGELAPRTILWNGPMGVFEWEPYAAGTMGIARVLAEHADAITVVGGGETAMACVRAGVADRITHVSTGGGASLELLEGKELPGVVALSERS